jgi:hypothetical protein
MEENWPEGNQEGEGSFQARQTAEEEENYLARNRAVGAVILADCLGKAASLVLH